MTPASAPLVLERSFEAPRERVFAAWTSPDVLRRWWGAGPDWTCPEVEIDLRPGGRYRLAMSNPAAGETYTVGGEFLEVEAPARLVYTWSWETPGAPSGDLTTVVTVEFREDAGRTVVVLTHGGFTDDAQRDSHADGWGACLDNLGVRVFPEGTS